MTMRWVVVVHGSNHEPFVVHVKSFSPLPVLRESIPLWTPVYCRTFIFALLSHPLRLRLGRVSRGRWVAARFLARGAGAVGARRASVALIVLERLNHLLLLAVRLELGLTVGVDLPLGEEVGATSSYFQSIRVRDTVSGEECLRTDAEGAPAQPRG